MAVKLRFDSFLLRRMILRKMALNWRILYINQSRFYMKNAFIALILGIALISFLSFTNRTGRAISVPDEDEYTQDDPILLDTTVPGKKSAGKTKSKTVPYDSFGKPKKMDSTQLK